MHASTIHSSSRQNIKFKVLSVTDRVPRPKMVYFVYIITLEVENALNRHTLLDIYDSSKHMAEVYSDPVKYL